MIFPIKGDTSTVEYETVRFTLRGAPPGSRGFTVSFAFQEIYTTLPKPKPVRGITEEPISDMYTTDVPIP